MREEVLQTLKNEITEIVGGKKEYRPFIDSSFRDNYSDLLTYLDTIEDEDTKYVYLKMLKARFDFNPELTIKKNEENRKAVRDSLAEELGVSKSTITQKYNSTYRLLSYKVEKYKEEKRKEFIKSCYDDVGELSLIKIANNFGIDALELRDALIDYSRSLTLKEYEIAMEFGFSQEADKVCNINLITTRIKELKDNKELPKTISNLFINNRERQLTHFLYSVKSIIEDYRKMQEEGIKTYYRK